jgi:redox-sensitive bicupin YhaK (pirin superfamily)
MIRLRLSNERGRAKYDWLDTRYSFSFSNYYDPRHMGFSDLRVINEDIVAPGGGFPTHGHKDMEILTCILSGALEHRDSMGNTSVIRPHEWQRMSAGTGVRHSEANASETDPVHLLQIWILPESEGLKPGYEQKLFAPEEKQGRLRLVASRGAREGSLTIHQDVSLYDGILSAGESIEHKFETGRNGWLQVVRGSLDVNGQKLNAGDGAAISAEDSLRITAADESEVLLFDLA